MNPGLGTGFPAECHGSLFGPFGWGCLRDPNPKAIPFPVPDMKPASRPRLSQHQVDASSSLRWVSELPRAFRHGVDGPPQTEEVLPGELEHVSPAYHPLARHDLFELLFKTGFCGMLQEGPQLEDAKGGTGSAAAEGTSTKVAAAELPERS